jgi:hypothetical protein
LILRAGEETNGPDFRLAVTSSVGRHVFRAATAFEVFHTPVGDAELEGEGEDEGEFAFVGQTTSNRRGSCVDADVAVVAPRQLAGEQGAESGAPPGAAMTACSVAAVG